MTNGVYNGVVKSQSEALARLTPFTLKVDLQPDYVNNSVTWSFGVPAGTPPGEYLLYASFGGYGTIATSYSCSMSPTRRRAARPPAILWWLTTADP